MESAYQRNLKTEEMAFSGVKEFPLGLLTLALLENDHTFPGSVPESLV